VCPECAEKLRIELTTLTPARIARGGAAAAGLALVACAAVGGLAIALGSENGTNPWVVGIGSIVSVRTIGRVARRMALAGGLPLQVLAAFFGLVMVLEVQAPFEFMGGRSEYGELAAALLAPIAAPIDFVLNMRRPENIPYLAFLAWAFYDLWRACAPIALSTKGPFPVQVGAPAAPPPSEAPDAKAAGLDFERPA